MTKEELQDEISAIDAIYPGCTTEVAPQIYNFKVLQHQGLELQLSFPQTYPDEAPSIIQVIVDDPVKFSDAGYLEKSFGSKLKEIFRSGEVCMFEFLSELDVMLESYSDRENSLEEKVKDLVIESRDTSPKDFIDRKEPKEQDVKAVDPLAGWIQSDPVVDRGSTFIGFTREVHSLDEAEHDLDILVADKKVSKAAHNISAWRIKGNGGVQYQDCDDDGETAAGGRLLHLLTVRIYIL